MRLVTRALALAALAVVLAVGGAGGSGDPEDGVELVRNPPICC